MTFVLGVVLFALCILISIAFHEAGHMYTAKAFGMTVRRYFIGFGPTMFSFRRGGTEYGVKWIPLGGFCDIAGMTPQDEMTQDEMTNPAHRAFIRFPGWQRLVVMFGGVFTNFLLGIVLIYVMAVSTGLPNVDRHPTPAVVSQVNQCIAVQPDGSCPLGSPAPARDAGLLPGDRVLAVAGAPVRDFAELVTAIQKRAGPTELRLERGGQQLTVIVNIARVPASVLGRSGDNLVGAIGVTPQQPDPATLRYGPAEAVGRTVTFTGIMFANTWQGLVEFPRRVPLLLDRIAGKDRPDSPVSVIGASVLGGDAVELGTWSLFLFLLVAFNLFIGAVNLLPLLPLDGGHMAVIGYEAARNTIRRAAGRSTGPPVDANRLMPLTVAVMIVLVGVGGLAILADIVNPIRLPR